ncbi:MAG: hypothetical protein ACRYF3_13020 [Janthinobacterium lividum]
MTQELAGKISADDVAALRDFLLRKPSVTAGLRQWTNGTLTFRIVRRSLRKATPDEQAVLGGEVGTLQEREIEFGNRAGTVFMTARAVVVLRRLPMIRAIRVLLGRRPLGDVLSPLGFDRVMRSEIVAVDSDVPLEQVSVLSVQEQPVAMLTECYRRTVIHREYPALRSGVGPDAGSLA